MELNEYWRVIRRRGWMPLLLVVVSVCAAAPLAFLGKPQYTASATVVARGNASQSFAEVATSNRLALRVLSDTKLPQTVGQLLRRIKIYPGRNFLYKVTVNDASAGEAVLLANTVATEASTLYQELGDGSGQPTLTDLEKQGDVFRQQYLAAAKAVLDFGRAHPDTAGATPKPKDSTVGATALQLQLDQQAAANAYLSYQQELTRARVGSIINGPGTAAHMVDEAVAAPDTIGRWLTIGYAAGLALALGIGIVFILEYFDHSVRRPEEVEELIGAPVMAIIPRGSPRTLRPAKGGVG